MNREEALECFNKIYGNTHASDTFLLQEEFSMLEQFIQESQQPKLSVDVDETLETLREYFKIDMARFLKCVEDLEQHIQAQASEIERLKEDDKQRYIDITNLCIEINKRDAQLNAIREVYESFDIHNKLIDQTSNNMYRLNKIGKILEGNNE